MDKKQFHELITSVYLLLFTDLHQFLVLNVDGMKTSCIIPHKIVCHNYSALFINSYGVYSKMWFLFLHKQSRMKYPTFE